MTIPTLTTAPLRHLGPKRFDDVEQYESEIPLLVPGYELLHELVPILVAAHLHGREARGLVVGCGPGRELVALTRQVEGLRLEGIDPSPSMVAAAERNAAFADLEGRVHVYRATLLEYAAAPSSYDVVVATLVSHFVPDDGARLAFFTKIGALLRPGGLSLVTDLADDGDLGTLLREAQVAWAVDAGIAIERATTMRQRLTSGFAALTADRLRAIALEAGLEVRGEFFRSFGVVGTALTKKGP